MKQKMITLMAVLAISRLTAVEFDATIPVLDMNEYFNPATKSVFVEKLDHALKDSGFFAVVNTGVDAQVLDDAYAACKSFFALPSEKKFQIFDPALNGQRGYIPGESAKGQMGGDFKEFIHIGSDRNIWPEGFNLETPMNTIFTALQTYMIPLEQAMAEALGESPDLINQMTTNGQSLLRAIHYPASPPKDAFWAAEHTDIDLFTILPRATAEGLQLKNSAGEWVDVIVPENAFIVNAGDMLENLSNGEFKSGLHRVVAKKEGYERYSIVFFIHPRYDVKLDPLASSIARTGGVQKYANATGLELLEERLVDLGLASPAMMQHLSDSGLMERLIEVGRASPKAMQKLKEAGLANEAILSQLDQLDSMKSLND